MLRVRSVLVQRTRTDFSAREEKIPRSERLVAFNGPSAFSSGWIRRFRK
jgi:hypothetical protein